MLLSRRPSVARSTCMLALLVVAGSWPADGFAQTGPKVLQRKRAVRSAPRPVRGEAKIPEDVAFGFVAEVDGSLLLRDWKIQAAVTGIQADAVSFRTAQGRSGTLAYRIPGGLRLALKAGQPISISHDHHVDHKRFSYDLHITSGETLILATSHRHRDEPPQDANSAELIFTGQRRGEQPRHVLFYWSHPDDHRLQSESRRARHYHAPVTLVQQGERVATLGKRQQAEVKLGQHDYVFLVVNSEQYQVKPAGEQLSPQPIDHDQGHSLEYVLVKKAD